MSSSVPSWDLFAALLAVLQEGSLSGAARKLGLTQPTVRRQIEELEQALGVVLFTRAPNGLLPTDAARQALPHAESIAASARALSRLVTDDPAVLRGTVRVSASEVVGIEVLPPILAAMRRAHPDLQVELVATNRTEDLLRRDADVAVRMVEPTQLGLVRKLACQIEVGLFASAGYLKEHPPPRSLADLSATHRQHWLIGYDSSRVLIDFMGQLGVQLSPRHFATRTESEVLQIAAIRAGLGIGVCQVPLSLANVPLVRVLPQVAAPLGAWVVMHEDLRANARVRHVFEALAQGLAAYARRERAPRAARKASRPRR